MKTNQLSFVLFVALAVSACSDDDSGNNHTQGNNNNNQSSVCGNGLIEASDYYDLDEVCDGSNLGGHTCESIGWEGGELSCTSRCRFDTTSCRGLSPCGNGVIDPGERCDGTDLGEMTCSTWGVGQLDGPGPLVCSPNCLAFNPILCDRVGTDCGNGIVDNDEDCDDGDANSDTEPNACRTICMRPFCGDGVLDDGEECDDGIANSNSIPDGCRLYKVPNTPSSCRRAYCGDDVMDTGEECDGRDLGGLQCSDHGFSGGELACSTECTIDTSGCTE